MHNLMKRTLGTATALAIATGGLVADADAGAASANTPSCRTDCITGLTVGGTPEGVEFHFGTSVLSRVRVVLSDADGSKPYVAKGGAIWGSNYDLPVADATRFAQGTAYRYSIFATDTGGSTWMRSGGFATLTRQASVTYNKFHVIKDGDSIGAGDFEGRSRCGNSDHWYDHDLSPLSTDRSQEIELNDGDEIALFQNTTCPGTVGPTIEAQTAAADDDDAYGMLDWAMHWWQPHSPYSAAGWSTMWYDEAYTISTVADPLAATATGSATTPLYAVSSGFDPVGDVANMRYTVSGIASFTHVAPDVAVPAGTSGPATLGMQVGAGQSPGAATVSWNPNAFPTAGSGTTLVQWRPSGATTWTSADVSDSAAHEFLVQNLAPAQSYEFMVSRKLSDGLTVLAGRAPFTTPAHTTTISGWPADTVTKPLGSAVATMVHLDGAPGRPVEIQYRRGTAPWTVLSTVHTGSAGALTVALKVGAGYTQWRLHAPGNGSYAEQTTASRMLVAKTAVTGFDSKSKTAKTGSHLTSAITVTPGSGRLVNVFYRKAGATAWKLSKQLTAGTTGKATVTETVLAGKYEWRVSVAAAATQGSAAVTATRTVTGV